MKIKIISITIITAFCVALFAFKPVSDQNSPIKWHTMSEAIALSKTKKKKVFIDVYTDWCGWCKVMDKKTFSDPKIAEYINKNYYAVKLDAESQTELLYKGQKISESQLAGQVFKVTGYPTTLYLDENFDLLSPMSGYLELPMFTKIIKYYGDDHYKKESWDDFGKNYK